MVSHELVRRFALEISLVSTTENINIIWGGGTGFSELISQIDRSYIPPERKDVDLFIPNNQNNLHKLVHVFENMGFSVDFIEPKLCVGHARKPLYTGEQLCVDLLQIIETNSGPAVAKYGDLVELGGIADLIPATTTNSKYGLPLFSAATQRDIATARIDKKDRMVENMSRIALIDKYFPNIN